MGPTQADTEARLLRLLDLTNDWLRYAEAKNGVMIGLTSAGAVGTLAALGQVTGGDLRSVALVFLIVGEAALLPELGLALRSFLPTTDLARWVTGRRGRPAAEDNLYFYGHVAKYSPRHLAEAVARRYEGATRDEPLGEAALDLAAQVVTNARITLWKLRLFVPAVACFGIGVLFATIAVLASLV